MAPWLCASRAGRGTTLFGVLMLGLLVTVAGCDRSPIQPKEPPPPPGVTVQSVTVTGRTLLSGPADTSQLVATAQLSDRTTRDVTATARWSSTDPRIVTVSGGFLTAVAYGTAAVTAAVTADAASSAPVGRADIRVRPEGTFLIKGRVTEHSQFGVADANVRAVSPSQTFTAKTDYDGHYTLPASVGDVTLTIEKQGYGTQTNHLSVQRDEVVDVLLQPVGRAGLSGVYTLTITAASSCTLPEELMRRTYLARIVEHSDGRLIVDLSGATFFNFGSSPGFTGTRSGNELHFDIDGSDYLEYSVIETIDASGYTFLNYTGKATGTLGEAGIVATLDARIQLTHYIEGAVVASCTATNHRMEFVRLGT